MENMSPQNRMISEIKVSVVVPVYNVERYLEECLNSLVRQTLSDIEILLIDDGSTDSSGTICDQYAEKYDHIEVIHQSNHGLGNVRNVGLSRAKGKYVYFIDSDDWIDDDTLLILYEKAESYHLDSILFSAESFSDDSELSFNPDEYCRTAFLDKVISGKDLFGNLCYVHEYYAVAWLRFYRREFLVQKHILYSEGIIHEDEVPGLISLIEAERVMCINNRFYKHRVRKGSIITSKRAYDSALGYMYAWRALLKYCQKFDFKEKRVYLQYINSLFSLAIMMYYTTFNAEDKKRFKKVRKETIKKIVLCIKDVGRGRMMFLCNPFLYQILSHQK